MVRGSMKVLAGLVLAGCVSVGAALAAPDSVALAQTREAMTAAYSKQVEDATRAIDSGRLEGEALADAYRKRGVGSSHLGQYAAAVTDFSRAIDLDGFNPQYYQDRAIAYLRLREFTQANTDLDMVLGLDRDNFNGLREKGRVAFYQGDFDGAMRHFVKASRVIERDGQVYAAMWVNMAALRAGYPAPMSLELSGNARERWPVPAALLLQGEGSPEAVLKRADVDNPGTFLSLQCEAHFYVGQHHLLKGRKDEARASFQAAVDTGKTDYMEYDWALRELELLK